ncbi:hypothetical protein BJV82DRAFT_559250 [Fennellomyces sp. T-0311]|nr:hypothetical protein BJV82DRAFT_559250 [Fennellomyces sp. T-0311]
MASTSSLFKPIKVGNIQLEHRVVLPPMNRFRNDENRVPTALVEEYYEQRTTKGGLLINEGTGISPGAGVYPGQTSIFTQEQIQGWKRVTDRVHAKGGFIFCQLWHPGRATNSSLLPDNTLPISSSATPIKEGIFPITGKKYETPRALRIDEIPGIIQEYVQAAKNAIEAGFDGVEVHGANGYLIDQFTNSSTNFRTDKYGGSVENRVRFALEVVQAVCDAIGESYVGIRLSPWSEFHGIYDDTPYETWGYLVKELQARNPNLAYLHMVEPRGDHGRKTVNDTTNTLDPFRALWKGPFISAGGYTYDPKLAEDVADSTGNLIAFGRSFVANPDIVYRLKYGLPLTKYDRSTFYTNGAVGYVDYPFYEDVQN